MDDQKAWNEKQDIDIDKVDNKVGDLNYSHNNYVTDGQDVTMAIGDLDKATQEAYEEALKHTTVSGDGNFVVKPSENLNGSTDYKVSLAPNVDIEESLTVGGEEGITINKGDQGTINGLTNTKWEPETHTYEGSDQAATEGQLHDVSEGLQQNIDKVDHKVGDLDFSGTNYVENKDNVTDAITELDGAIKNNQTAVENLDNNAVKYDVQDGVVDKTSVTLGDGQTPTGLHNVAAGAVTATSTDAVNGSQLWEVDQKVNANTSAISGLNSRVDTLDGRIDKVGANAAALAALHPLDFDPDDKWDFAAGVGNYGGENAMAVGAFYRPNEDTMFSVGGSFGTGENMVNAGVSFKIGQGNHISTSRVAMAKEIETLRHNVAQLTELVNKLVGSQDQIQNAMTTPFPDVPENHWAYETIEQMRERGIVEGYPDGTFGGDRQMTRYEFATIVYRALQKGLGMNEELQRLVDEFKPELELIRVDTIAQDSEGNPTIERVRVNKA